MILVDIYVPVLDEVYDFYADENTEAGLFIEEAAEMICQKEQCPLKGKPEDLTLWRCSGRYRIGKGQTLQEAGIKAGERLLLV
ncbi:MAG: hypothetical protein ACLUJN_06185 [Blautia sp.]